MKLWMSAIALSSVFIACNKAPQSTNFEPARRSQFMLVTHETITSQAAAESSCQFICEQESAYWNGYYTEQNPFAKEQAGGICECIRAPDPYPGRAPLRFTLKDSDIEETYGEIEGIATEIQNYGLALQSTSTAGGGRASASAGGGQASASAGGASAKAGGGGGDGTSSKAGGRSANGDGSMTGKIGSQVAKSKAGSKDGAESSGFTIKASAGAAVASASSGGSEANAASAVSSTAGDGAGAEAGSSRSPGDPFGNRQKAVGSSASSSGF